jgi:2-methylaconitate cis-trans-isomerase PrpF
VHDVTKQERDGEIKIGHTSGVMPVRARVGRDGHAWRIDQAVYHRTARRLAEGTAFIRSSAIPPGSTR